MIYTVAHMSFQTDDLRRSHTEVEARSPEEALAIFNELAAWRSEYPYCWTQATIDDVWKTGGPVYRKDGVIYEDDQPVQKPVPPEPDPEIWVVPQAEKIPLTQNGIRPKIDSVRKTAKRNTIRSHNGN